MNKFIFKIYFFTLITSVCIHPSSSPEESHTICKEDIENVFEKIVTTETNDQPTLEQIIYTISESFDFFNFLKQIPSAISKIKEMSDVFVLNDPRIDPSLLKRSLLKQVTYDKNVSLEQQNDQKRYFHMVKLQQVAEQKRAEWQKKSYQEEYVRKQKRDIAKENKKLEKLKPIIEQQSLFKVEKKSRQAIERREKHELFIRALNILQSVPKSKEKICKNASKKRSTV